MHKHVHCAKQQFAPHKPLTTSALPHYPNKGSSNYLTMLLEHQLVVCASLDWSIISLSALQVLYIQIPCKRLTVGEKSSSRLIAYRLSWTPGSTRAIGLAYVYRLPVSSSLSPLLRCISDEPGGDAGGGAARPPKRLRGTKAKERRSLIAYTPACASDDVGKTQLAIIFA